MILKGMISTFAVHTKHMKQNENESRKKEGASGKKSCEINADIEFRVYMHTQYIPFDACAQVQANLVIFLRKDRALSFFFHRISNEYCRVSLKRILFQTTGILHSFV